MQSVPIIILLALINSMTGLSTGCSSALNSKLACFRRYMDYAAAPVGVVSSKPSYIKFLLYTRESKMGVPVPKVSQQWLRHAGFNKTRRTYVLAPGWLSMPPHPWVLKVKKELLRRTARNVFVVDWAFCSVNVNYIEVIETCLLDTTETLAKFLQDLARIGVSLGTVHMVGHSLGAHLLGGVHNFGIQVGRITGLDPSIYNSLQFVKAPFAGLSSQGAVFVDIIHTNRVFGSGELQGHADFFVNGALRQPGCDALVSDCCDHSRAPVYFIESIRNPKKFLAKVCPSLREALYGDECKQTNYVFMGYKANPMYHGVFYVKTEKPAESIQLAPSTCDLMEPN